MVLQGHVIVMVVGGHSVGVSNFFTICVFEWHGFILLYAYCDAAVTVRDIDDVDVVWPAALDRLGFGDYRADAEAVLRDCKAVAAKRRRQSTRLENLGIPEEELLRQQQELFAKVCWLIDNYCYYAVRCIVLNVTKTVRYALLFVSSQNVISLVCDWLTWTSVSINAKHNTDGFLTNEIPETFTETKVQWTFLGLTFMSGG
jgi:hypothetical protein